jgi:hypothetical protein
VSNAQNTQALIMEITQSVIAVLVVAGGGVAVLSGNAHVADVTPFVGMVLGFYFSKMVAGQTATAVPATPPTAEPPKGA